MAYSQPPMSDDIEVMKEAGHRNLSKWFDSMSEFVSDVENNCSRASISNFENRGRWTGADKLADALRIVRTGISKHNDAIRKLTDAVSVDLPTTVDAWEATVSGPIPIVPAAIAGLPDCMLRPVQEETSGVPLRIFVSVASSGGCREDVLEARGIAVLALLESLAAKRPTELYLFAEYDDARGKGFNAPVIRVASMPLDLTALTGALLSPCVARMLMMAWADNNAGFLGTWAWGGASPDRADTMKLTRAALGLNPEDLLIPAAFLNQRDLIVQDPAQWVRNQIAETEKLNNRGGAE